MICPKCGFSQPEEIYCASCGINVVNFSRKKRRRLYTRLIVLACAAAGLFLTLGLFYGHQEREEKALVKEAPPDRSFQKERAFATAADRLKTIPPSPAATMPSKAPQETADARRASASPGEAAAPVLDPAKPDGDEDLTASQWYEAGRSLNDDSAEEMRCYQAAIEADPRFAPAYYALGGIHFRLAEYEQADRFFGKFLEFASEEERQAYDIYVYYSPEEAEALAPKGKSDRTQTADGERPPSPQAKAEQNQGEEGVAPDRELKTVVPFRSVRGHIGVPVILNDGVEASMLLDTGAGVTLLSKKMASVLNLPLSEKGAFNLKTVSGDTQAPATRLKSIRLGELKKIDFQVAVSDLNLAEGRFDGILGMDFLEDYDIHIDNRSGRITLRGGTRNRR